RAGDRQVLAAERRPVQVARLAFAMDLVERPVLDRLACRVAPLRQLLHPDLEDQALLVPGFIGRDHVHPGETGVPLAVDETGLAARSPPVDGSDRVGTADTRRGQFVCEI